MTAVLVHGVPETSALWGPLATHLTGQEVVTLGLPGFGRPLPDGFEPTMEVYADWLRGELEAMPGPVHLVAHDWGALLSLRVLADRPTNVASWVLDMGNLDDDFVWHDMAQLWQTPGAGEEFMDGMVAMSTEDRAAMLGGSGVPESSAVEMAGPIDATMATAILALYRSATKIGAEWGPGIDQVTGSGLIIDAANDPYRKPDSAAALAARTGADIATLADCGHWWMLEDPAGAAAAIDGFWAGLS
jgi:pimeloyl-ACP methyl ester carboxylesterase